jgi:hypothetical protein
MQNDPLASFSLFGLPPNALEDAFERAHAHMRATAPSAATAVPTVDPLSGNDPRDDAGADDEPALDGNELLRVVREPIEWLLTLAHRLASSVPDDIAAIDRLRAAFHARLAGRPIGVRRSDALTAFGVLLGALDPDVVLQSVTRTIADGVATLLTCEDAALAAQLARIADTFPALSVHHACVPRRRRSRTARTTSTP